MSTAVAAAFPGMVTALDVEAMSALLAESLEQAGETLSVEDLKVLDVRYRPNQPCWVLYRLKGRDSDGKTRRQLLSGQLRAADASLPPLPDQIRDRYHDYAPEWLRSPVLHVPALPMAIYPYPVDTALPGLFESVSPDAMKVRLRALWSDRNVRVRTVDVRPMGYTPHARAAFGYEVLCEERDGGLPELRRLIGKMHAKKPAYRLFQDSWAVWQAGGRRIGLAPPVGYIGAIGLTLQERVDGVRLGALVDQPGLEQMTRRTGRAIARLHSLDIPLTARRKLEEEVRGIERWAGVLARIRPDLDGRITDLRDRILAQVAARLRMCAPVHADFHHTNVLVDGGRVTIIDLDEMAFGDPMLDVGRFMASLRVPSRRVFGRIDALTEAGEAFLEAYMRCRQGDERRARLFEASSLLTAAGSSFRVQRDGWEEEVELLIGESERVLALSVRGSSFPSAILDGRPRLDRDERARWARDGTFMQAALDPHLRKTYGALVERCRVQKGGSAEVRYSLKGDRGGKRWRVQLAGIDKPGGTRSLATALRELGTRLEGDSVAPRIPKPVAVLKGVGQLVWEAPAGTSLADLPPRDDTDVVLANVGRALRAIHVSGLTVERTLGPDARLRDVRRTIDGLAAKHRDVQRVARPLFRAVREALRSSPERTAPTLRIVHPRHVIVDHDGVGLRRVEDVVMGDPLSDVADLSARLLQLGIVREQANRSEEVRLIADVDSAGTAARALATGYRDGLGSDPLTGSIAAWIPAFEALALLRLAARRPEADGAHALLELAEARLGDHRAALAGDRPGRPSELEAALPTEPARELALAVARKCRGRTRVVGTGLLRDELELTGVDLESASGEARTVVIADLGQADDPVGQVGRVWRDLPVKGRMIVVARNADGSDEGGASPFSRKDLWRILRPLARPHVESEQPFAWLVMTLEKRKRRPGKVAGPTARDRRYAATASLCRGRVLELGCGEGYLSGLLSRRGHEVTGVDLNPPKIQTARRVHPNVTFHEGDIRTVQLPDAPYDTVVLAEVLEHVTEKPGQEILVRAWSLVAPGGRLVVSVPNENLIPHTNHLRQFDLEGLCTLLAPFGEPQPVTRQPYKWLMVYVDRPEVG